MDFFIGCFFTKAVAIAAYPQMALSSGLISEIPEPTCTGARSQREPDVSADNNEDNNLAVVVGLSDVASRFLQLFLVGVSE